MEGFAGSLGVHCDFCHAADPKNVGPNGRPQLNFADDSKPDKKIARIMYTMVQQINGDYISKAMALDPDAMGMKVTCGTCHRGHEMPEEFVIPQEHGPGGPPAGSAPPGHERRRPARHRRRNRIHPAAARGVHREMRLHAGAAGAFVAQDYTGSVCGCSWESRWRMQWCASSPA